jgi:uncharacterized surface protein with fasciclin (FAS1) repeats/sporulation protein YlmC with PRC-barrel domain
MHRMPPKIVRGAALLTAAALAPAAPRADLLEALAQDGRFATFAQTLGGADAADALEEIDQVTIFAPTDEAFRRLPDDLEDRLLAPENEAALERVLGLHMVRGALHGSTEIPVEMESLSGDRLVATYTRGALTLRPAPEEDAADPEAALTARAANEARVVFGDLRRDDGVIHALDAVLLPTGLDLARPGDAAGPAPRPEAPSGGSGSASEDFARRIAETADAVDMTPADAGPAGPQAPQAGAPAAEGPEPDTVTVEIEPAEPSPEPGSGDEGTAAGAAARSPASSGDAAASEDAPSADGAGMRADGAPASSPASSGDAEAISLTRSLVSLQDLVGRDVVASQGGETLGEVADVFISLDTARVEEIAVAVDSGLLDLFARETRVKTGDVAIDPLRGVVIVDRARLQKADAGGE